MQTTITKIKNGMSCFEVLQAKISNLETAYSRMTEEESKRSAAIEAMEKVYSNTTTPRRTRFELSVEIPVQREALEEYRQRSGRVYAELKGMRKALDLILLITNHGGELTERNRAAVESILNY